MSDQKHVLDFNGNKTGGECLSEEIIEHISDGIVLDSSFTLTSWNVYKQKSEGLTQELTRWAEQSDLLLLQEAVKNQSLQSIFAQDSWFWRQAEAFRLEGNHGMDTVGVATLSKVKPSMSCGWWSTEPWIRFPKTALLTVLPIHAGETLWVVNIHGINFTLGTNEFEQQLKQIQEVLSQHDGPLIVAGDFNSWREKRLLHLRDFRESLQLQEISWPNDKRVTIFNQPIDHIFYRKLTVKEQKSKSTRASDHTPLWVRFSLKGNTH